MPERGAFLPGWTAWAIARPRRALAAVALATLAAAPGLLRLTLRTDGRALAPPADRAVRADVEVRRHFGLRDSIVVLLETPRADGVYDPAVLRRLAALTAALARLPGVGPQNVVSLATERGDRVDPGTLHFRTLLNPLPDTPRRLADLRDTVAAIPALRGTLISRDARAAAVVVGAPDGGAGPGGYDRAALCRRVAEVAAPFAAAGERVLVVGAPVAEALLGDAIRRDLALLLPLSIALIAAVIWFGCRRLWAVAIAMGEVACCLVCTFGLMGWLGVPIYLTTYLLPLIITLVGVADEIHLLWRYQRVLAGALPNGDDSGHPAAVRAAAAEVMRPVVLSSLAALVAFLSFVSSSIPPIRSFGLFAAVGMLVCAVYALTAVPAALALLPPAALRRPERPRRAPAVALAAALVLRPRVTLVALAAILAALAAGLGRLEVQDSWIDGFAPGSPFRLATERADALLDGTHVLLLDVAFSAPLTDIGRRGPLLDAASWRALAELERFAAARPEVGGVLGPYDELATASYLAHARQAGTRTVPREPARIERLLRTFDEVRGERRRREAIDDDLRRALVTVFLRDANFRDTARLVAALRRFERERLRPAGARLELAGDVAVSQAMIPAVVESQVVSLLAALAGVLAAVWLFYRSLGLAVCATLPPALAALAIFGTMGWAGIPLGVATSMFSALTLGIGVDYGVHFMDRFAAAPAASERSLFALRVVGPEVTADVVAIALGFGLFALSRVPAVGRLGLLVCVALLASWLLTLVGLGALLAGRRR